MYGRPEDDMPMKENRLTANYNALKALFRELRNLEVTVQEIQQAPIQVEPPMNIGEELMSFDKFWITLEKDLTEIRTRISQVNDKIREIIYG